MSVNDYEPLRGSGALVAYFFLRICGRSITSSTFDRSTQSRGRVDQTRRTCSRLVAVASGLHDGHATE
jgi:hypothetical protein